ncbi:MAG TPA: hypothetical protein VM581_01980, partial [Magnetospirillaceae bacterium]|nr:hypothetical protein [Magnetospirillaceae bacterium]
MIDLLRAKATRTRVSEVVYTGLNLLLPIAVLFLVRLDPPYLAFALVILSKWRILALRPRFWWVNIKANLADLFVGISAVALIYLSQGSFGMQVALTVLYELWLIVLKPKSGAHGILLQAGVAQVVSLIALFNFSVLLPEFVVIAACWLIGYVTARHVVSNYEESNIELLSVIWGLFLAEIGWIVYRWTNIYNLGLPIKIPQIALIMLVIGFCAARMYDFSKN